MAHARKSRRALAGPAPSQDGDEVQINQKLSGKTLMYHNAVI